MGRRKRLTALSTTLVALLLASGCTVHVRPPAPPRARVVTIDRGHVHGDRCGHFRHDGRWYFVRGHAHGPGCGHHKVRGVWVLRR